jgi:predicted ATPase
MLTRLKVSGFKNLVDVDVRFGPFTCIAGVNGVGKSNLFDAIRFISALANGKTFAEAAMSVREEDSTSSDIRSLFHRVGNEYAEKMSFEAEMIIPKEGIDDLGQPAKATITSLRYALTLAYRMDETLASLGGSLELIEERLERIGWQDNLKYLKFPHKPAWRKSVLQGRRATSFISTNENQIIRLNQDGSKGRAKSILAANLPRTVLSNVNAIESPTALIVRREMQSWRLLQLEPAALRKPDKFMTKPGLGANGSHLPATLYHLARSQKNNSDSSVYERIASRLSELIDDVYDLQIDRDEKREMLTLQIKDRYETIYPAHSLSDGTLRFLALAVLERDPNASGLLCLEEPENGIHPDRIPAILKLLKDIATDTDEAVSEDNPLRQVIINTHSPAVVRQVPEDSLLVAELKEMVDQNKKIFKRTCFSFLPQTWRSEIQTDIHPVAMGKLLAYLDPGINYEEDKSEELQINSLKPKRIIDRQDVRQMLLSDIGD